MCLEVTKVIKRKSGKKVAKNPPVSLLTLTLSLSTFSPLYSLAPNPHSSISSWNLPRRPLYSHWQLCRLEGVKGQVEGKQGGSWHWDRELFLAHSDLPVPTLTSKHAPGLQPLRDLEAGWRDRACWRQER